MARFFGRRRSNSFVRGGAMGQELAWSALALARGERLPPSNSLYGFPPKVVWFRRGNCSTRDIRSIFQDHLDNIVQFHNDTEAAFLVIEENLMTSIIRGLERIARTNS
jgi:hypothetical protein